VKRTTNGVVRKKNAQTDEPNQPRGVNHHPLSICP
jgi:hypothetical protein